MFYYFLLSNTFKENFIYTSNSLTKFIIKNKNKNPRSTNLYIKFYNKFCKTIINWKLIKNLIQKSGSELH
jgi:hypothetical protein